MNPVQEIADTIQEFEYRKAVALTTFERVMQKKPEKRRNIVSFFNIEGEEMIEHGFYCDYNPRLKRAIRGCCLFYTKEKAETLMMAYYLSDPKERETFKNNLLNSQVSNRASTQKPNPDLKKVSTLELWNTLWESQMDLVRPYSRYIRKPMVALNMLPQLKKQSVSEKKKIEQLVKDSLDITKVGGLEAGVPYLANRLLPYFYKECSQKSAEINRPEKIKRTKSILHSFAWLLLTQDRSNAISEIHRGLFPMTKSELKALNRFHDYDC